MPVLFVGDIHLGRRPSGLDGAFAAAGLDAVRLAPAAAWRSTVELAERTRPRAVVLAGDVVDDERDRFEAYAHLERGVRQLVDLGIPVLGVAGNHDVLVLPRLADRIKAFRLLGRDGRWECVPLEGDGPDMDLVGWSFPRPRVLDDPLDHASFQGALAGCRAGAALLGVMHGDLGARGSPYAPIDARKMAEGEVAGWFLGHIHRPDDLTGPRPIGYLGSLTGMDAGEPGVHGPWNVQVEGGQVRARQEPLAPVRWEALDVALGDDCTYRDAVHARVCAAAAQRALDPTFADPRLRCVIARVTLSGRSAGHAAARAFAREHQPDRDLLDVAGRPWIIDRVVAATQPPIDLVALAAEASPAGRVAARILELERGGADDLVVRADAQVERLSTGRWQLGSNDARMDPRAALLKAAWRALDALLAHRSEAQ
ncbi:MAG: metallophosphoesterase family protein [Myxococcota bacterium]